MNSLAKKKKFPGTDQPTVVLPLIVFPVMPGETVGDIVTAVIGIGDVVAVSLVVIAGTEVAGNDEVVVVGVGVGVETVWVVVMIVVAGIVVWFIVGTVLVVPGIVVTVVFAVSPATTHCWTMVSGPISFHTVSETL